MLRHRGNAGYSLIELMVVVTIIAVVSALVLPGMISAMKERRCQQAAVSVLDAYRQVRSRAMFRGRAQLLVASQTTSPAGPAIRFTAYEGSTSSCRTSTFPIGDATRVTLSLDLSATAYSEDGVTAQFSLPAGTTNLELCYTPLGTALFRQTSTEAFSNDSTTMGSGGVFQVDVQRRVGGSDLGARRRVVIPLGGNPRMRT
ncbi:MAG: type II secretion system protein [Deltaproteobacteria bacterium]|nr:type II secretion system protein [Deltaproteobacteria bacterium]